MISNHHKKPCHSEPVWVFLVWFSLRETKTSICKFFGKLLFGGSILAWYIITRNVLCLHTQVHMWWKYYEMEFGIEEGKIILKLREMANNAKISIYGTLMSNQNPKTAALVTSLFLLLSAQTARYHYCQFLMWSLHPTLCCNNNATKPLAVCQLIF